MIVIIYKIKELLKIRRLRWFSLLTISLILSLLWRPPSTMEVISVARTIQSGESLQPEDLITKKIPEYLKSDSFISIAEKNLILGKTVYRLLGKDELITWSAFENADSSHIPAIPSGHRFVVIPISNLSDMEGVLHGYEHVDLLFSPDALSAEKNTGRLILENVQIYPAATEHQVGKMGFILPVAQATHLLDVRKSGSFSIMLRNPSDPDKKILNDRPTNQTVEFIYGLNHSARSSN